MAGRRTTEDKMLPCAFCGTKGHIVKDPVFNRWYPFCGGCGATTAQRFRFKSAARRWWDKRAPAPAGFPPAVTKSAITTVAGVRREVARIEAIKDDYESAHGAEDHLHQEVLRAISLGQCQVDPPEDVAAEALKTLDIDFTRHCA